MEALLSILGSVASIFGAGWALVEAKNAKSSADTAERIRREIVGRRRTAEVAHVQSELRRVIAIVAKVGPASKPQQIRGLNAAHIAREVEALVTLLMEQSNHFSDLYADRAVELRNDLRADIEGLAEAATPEDKKTFGKSIYHKLENFMPVVKRVVDEHQDQPLNA